MPSSFNSTSSTWQKKLQDKCCAARIPQPVYEMFSDKRGGRTAWSSRVTVSGQCIPSRFWYDGRYIDNAKEDAAELALKTVFNYTEQVGNENSKTWT